jgi:acyl-CoA synthetase (AMP-forming)/AMP-acid ligase II
VILVCVNPAYRPGELRYVLAQSGSRVVISATEHTTSDYRAMLADELKFREAVGGVASGFTARCVTSKTSSTYETQLSTSTMRIVVGD